MNDNRAIISEAVRIAISAILAIALCGLMLAICGCKAQKEYVPVSECHQESLRTDSAILNAIISTLRESMRSSDKSSDSLIRIDKETVTLNEQGDTTRLTKTEYVYISSKREKELEREIVKKDSIIDSLRIKLSSVKTDTIPVPCPVERKLTKWERTKIDYGGYALCVLAAGVVLALALLIRRFYKPRK